MHNLQEGLAEPIPGPHFGVPAASSASHMPACYGVCCGRHGRCARYEAVEGSPVDAIAYCGKGYPMFVAREVAS